MLRNRVLIILVGGIVALTVGCSGRKPVKVLVTLDGAPVDGATVSLASDEMKGTVSGRTGSDGTATLESSTKSGVAPGTYKVVVTKTAVMGGAPPKGPDGQYKMEDMGKMMKEGAAKTAKSELPAAYSNVKSTPLTLTVPPSETPAKLELKAKP